MKEALLWKIVGLTVLRPGGTVSDYSSGAVFNIRGQQTTTENGVLVLVDGIERSIEYLTVDEVESVTVLKDAAAVALLGYQGVNGAILVKTKRGVEGRQISVSYDHKFTFNPKAANFVDAPTYANALPTKRVSTTVWHPCRTIMSCRLFLTGT